MPDKSSVVNGWVRDDIVVTGKTVLITGANTGIGFETALDLTRRGARVIMACRDLNKAENAKEKILEEVKDANLVIKKLDLSSLASVRECAKDVNESEERLDILINNAGVMMCPPWKTEEGFEMQIGTNHIGHFLLTNLLLDLIKKSAPSRIVILSSKAYEFGTMDWDHLMQESNYNSLKAYGISKLANIHHCTELSRRLEGTGVACFAVHPGMVKSDLGRHMSSSNEHLPFLWKIGWSIALPIAKRFNIPTKKGAQTSIYCAVAPELAKESGKYYTNCVEESLSSKARNKHDAEKLWKLSEEWTKESAKAVDKKDMQSIANETLTPQQENIVNTNKISAPKS